MRPCLSYFTAEVYLTVLLTKERLTLDREESFFNSRVINDFAVFQKLSDVIVANRITQQLNEAIDKVYTRDIFHSDI